MKDFVRENWKIAAICAAGALFLSLLTGLIARNPFGVALFRAFLLALLFAGLGVGGRLLVRAYLPDLAAAGGGDGQAKPEETRGANVDITVGEDEAPAPPSPPPPAEAEPSLAEAAEEDTVSDLDDVTSRAEAEALGDLAEELSQDDLPEDAEPGQASGDEGIGGTDDGEQAEGRGRSVAAAEGPVPSAGDSDLDSLPDISNLEVAAPEAAPRRGRAAGGEATTPNDALKGSLSGQDPATLARAIRTVLKRDEKG